jgi:hypothetical protein
MAQRFRWTFVPVLVIGLALIVAPFAMSLPSKASAGQKLLDNFHPIMQPAAVRKTLAYDKGLFRFQWGRVEMIRGARIGLGHVTPPA